MLRLVNTSFIVSFLKKYFYCDFDNSERVVFYGDGHGLVNLFDDRRRSVHACINAFRGHSRALFYHHEPGPK